MRKWKTDQFKKMNYKTIRLRHFKLKWVFEKTAQQQQGSVEANKTANSDLAQQIKQLANLTQHQSYNKC